MDPDMFEKLITKHYEKLACQAKRWLTVLGGALTSVVAFIAALGSIL
jgi:hypothetical protein